MCTSTGQCVAGDEPRVEERAAPREGDGPPPPGYHYESKRRIGMLIGGVVPLGIGYGLSILYGLAMLTSSSGSGFYTGSGNFLYFVPVLGPLFRQAVAMSSSTSRYYSSGWVGVDLLLTIVFTAAQAVGLTFTLLGIFKKTQVLVKDGESAWKETAPGGVSVAIAPVFSPYGGGGLSLVLVH